MRRYVQTSRIRANEAPGAETSFGLRRQAKRDAALHRFVREKTSPRATVGEWSQSAVAAALCRRSP